MADVVSEVYDDIESAMTKRSVIAGLSSGLKDLDALTNGFGEGQLIIIAGRPAMGKSAAMDNIALANAKNDIPVFYATSERTKKEVVLRMAAIESGINSIKLSTGNVTQQEASRFTEAVGRIAKYPIYFDDAPMPRPRDVYAQADWMIKRHGCKLVVFDGMYRAKTGDEQIDKNEHRKYGTIALELKTLARALNIPVITTHQLSRDVEKRNDKRPMMSDLRESGRIEEEADKIVFLYRDEVYNPATESPSVCEWILSKHRNGATGTIISYYEKSITKFVDYRGTKVDLSEL
jgi:replicative DNA helicase